MERRLLPRLFRVLVFGVVGLIAAGAMGILAMVSPLGPVLCFFVLIGATIVIAVAIADEPAPTPDLCAGCAYDLAGLPPRGTCPECGFPYDLDTSPPQLARMP